MFMIFSNFVLWYPSMVIRHEQYIFMIHVMTQLQGRDRNNFQKLIKILQGHPQGDKHMPKVVSRRNKISTLFVIKSLFNVSLCTWNTFISHVVCLDKTSNSWYNYSGPFLGRKFCGMHRIPNLFKIRFFPVENILFPILW